MSMNVVKLLFFGLLCIGFPIQGEEDDDDWLEDYLIQDEISDALDEAKEEACKSVLWEDFNDTEVSSYLFETWYKKRILKNYAPLSDGYIKKSYGKNDIIYLEFYQKIKTISNQHRLLSGEGNIVSDRFNKALERKSKEEWFYIDLKTRCYVRARKHGLGYMAEFKCEVGYRRKEFEALIEQEEQKNHVN